MTDPTQVCEDVLRADKAYNIEHEILPSENRIIDRLLDRRLELADAYAEIHDKLHARRYGIKTLLGVVTNVAAFWNPDAVSEAREGRARLKELNREITQAAYDLSSLLEERSALHNHSGFSSGTHFHIVDIIDAASSGNGFYLFHLREELKPLSARYDLKYWPSLPDIMRIIGQDADEADTGPTDPLTAAATTGLRGSRADFFKALFEGIKENGTAYYGHLPRGFSLTDETLASLANCALDFGPDELVDGPYVKRLRQRSREARRTKRNET